MLVKVTLGQVIRSALAVKHSQIHLAVDRLMPTGPWGAAPGAWPTLGPPAGKAAAVAGGEG